MSRLLLAVIAFALLLATTPARALQVLRFADIVAEPAAAGAERISREQWVARLDWLAEQGYRPVSLQQVLDADREPLPPKALLLLFDGGYASLATEAWPLLRAYGWPAVAALPTARIGTPGHLDWAQVRAIASAGAIEFISAGHALDEPIVAMPQGLRLPAAAYRAWSADGYEDAAGFDARLRADLEASQALFESQLGRRARALAWPQGAWVTASWSVAEALGFELGIDHSGRGRITPQRLGARDLAGAGSLADFAAELRPQRERAERVLMLRMAELGAADPATFEARLDAMVERVAALAPSAVWLEAASAHGTAWFPQRDSAPQADLWSRVAVLIQRKAGSRVLAWLPADPQPQDGGALIARIEDLVTYGALDGLVLEVNENIGCPATAFARASALRPELQTVLLGPSAAPCPGAQRLALRLPADRLGRQALPMLITELRAQDATLGQLLVLPASLSDAALIRAAEALHAQGARHLGVDSADASDSALRAAASVRRFPYLPGEAR